MQTETLIELPSTVASLTTVRSTLIQSSLITLKARGHFDQYMSLLDPRYHNAVLETLAPEWLPVDIGMAHYQACDGLNLRPNELHEIGEQVGERIQGTFISLLLRNARTLGLTPWVPLGQFQRLWERLMQGGAVGVARTSAKDATVDIRRLALCRYAYFRAAFCGVIACAIKLGAGKGVSVRLGSGSGQELRCVFKCSWV